MSNNLNLVSLNVYGMHYGNEVMEYLQNVAIFADVVFLSEVPNSSQQAGRLLRKNEWYWQSNGHQLVNRCFPAEQFDCYHQANAVEDIVCLETGKIFTQVRYGNTMVIKTSLKQHYLDMRLAIYEEEMRPNFMQAVVIEKDSQRYLIAHFHGLYTQPNSKNDTAERIIQSDLVNKKLEWISRAHKCDHVILMGDFNLDLNTQSLAALTNHVTDAVMPTHNLIEKSGIVGTRTPLYRRYGTRGNMHANHFLASKAVLAEIDVYNDFNGSDHAPIEATLKTPVA